MGPPGWFRLVRAGAFAAVCAALSLIAHDLMACHPAPAWAGWTALAGMTGIGYCLADRRRPAWWILLAVGVAQVCLHEWFAWATPAAEPAPGHLAVTVHGGGHTVVHSLGTAPTHPVAGASGAAMLGAHALASVLVALWLHAGERAAWRALGAFADVVFGHAWRAFVLLAEADPPARRRSPGARPTRVDAVPWAGAALRHVLVRRGPPREAGAFLGAT